MFLQYQTQYGQITWQLSPVKPCAKFKVRKVPEQLYAPFTNPVPGNVKVVAMSLGYTNISQYSLKFFVIIHGKGAPSVAKTAPQEPAAPP